MSPGHLVTWSSPGAVFRFLVICGELALILVTIRLFQIDIRLSKVGEQHPFFILMCLAAGGFVVHAWLPPRFRLAFFCLLSAAAVVLFLGWVEGACVLGIGSALIGICYLPVPLVFRVLLLGLAGLFLVMARVEYRTAPFWPVLGSMFMFRLIVYLYDIRHERRPPLLPSLTYFFLLPNVCFPLFPVIDFKTFRQTYYDEDAYAIYQTGVAWIVRGLTHLLAYRYVKYYLLPAPHELGDLPHFALFLAANYALYLHVSGWFHIITGMLHLFGFNLPRTHHNYFLASSFTDIWRRINIYWKDFLAKVFFFPTFFALRRWGTQFALAAAGLGVFVVTWLLHSYQAFWLLGELPLRENEAVLWLAAGVLVGINLQLDLKRAQAGIRGQGSEVRRCRQGDHRAEVRDSSLTPDPCPLTPIQEILGAAVRSLQIMGTFTLVSLFFAAWSEPRSLAYLEALSFPAADTMTGIGLVMAVIVGMVTIGVIVQLARHRLYCRGLLPLPPSFARSAVLQTAALALLAVAGLPAVGEALGPWVHDRLAALRLDSPTALEVANVVRGYYEEIAEAGTQAAPLFGGSGRGDRQAHVHYIEITQEADDFLERELKPGWRGELAGSRLTINRLGMRDREEITLTKPAGVCRLAFVGSSVVMGYGVADDQPFPRLLEERLNAGRPEGVRYEVLNFGAGMSYVIHRRVLIERKVFAFEPDAIYYVAHQDELLGPPRHLTRLVTVGRELPYPSLRDVVQRAGVTQEMPWGQVEARLQPFARDIVRGTYTELVAECRRRNVLPVWVYLPMPGIADVPPQAHEVVKLAEAAGFVVVDLSKWSAGFAPGEVKLSPEDHHANARGHQLIAEKLEAALRERPDALPPGGRRRP
ncbi:MAG TPA: hypothetical protein VNK04_16635 [Gemmataceae bacterium]|nr:hypothetical protein [Gemmataceae bacterium]